MFHCLLRLTLKLDNLKVNLLSEQEYILIKQFRVLNVNNRNIVK
jgi:hypothetical protein